jgi:uncharacterized membrane protein YphA (DoxX/SURF4 family)
VKNYLSSFSQLFLRLSLGIGFISPGLDRLGAWGSHGSPGVIWGDWQHFSQYANKLMFFLPPVLAELLAILATIAELGFGIMLVLGLFTRIAAIGSGLLALSFAFCMSLAFGLSAPLTYSVFTVSAAGFLLGSTRNYQWSFDALVQKNRRRLAGNTSVRNSQ